MRFRRPIPIQPDYWLRRRVDAADLDGPTSPGVKQASMALSFRLKYVDRVAAQAKSVGVAVPGEYRNL